MNRLRILMTLVCIQIFFFNTIIGAICTNTPGYFGIQDNQIQNSKYPPPYQKSSTSLNSVNLTSHGPINISGNIDFTNQAYNENWPGNGTKESPYLISNYSIDYSGSFGIVINDTTIHFRLQNIRVISSSYGFYFSNITDAIVSNNTVISNAFGIFILNSSYNSFFNNTIISNYIHGINLENAQYNNFTDNIVTNNHIDGIYIDKSHENIFTDNNVSNNGYTGFSLHSFSTNNCFTKNIIKENIEYGFSVYDSTNNIIKQNMILDNGKNAILLYGSSNNNIDDNTISSNVYENIYLSSSLNTTIRIEDRPLATIAWSIPLFNSPLDNYTVFQNGVLLKKGIWIGSQPYILITLNSLSLGEYVFTLVVFFDSGGYMTDNIFVTLSDTRTPSVSNPPDYTYEEGVEDYYTISWTATDYNPDAYFLYFNGILIANEGWRSGRNVIVDVSGLSVGVFNFTIIFTDILGKTSRDSVWVTVIDTTPPVISIPADIAYEYGTYGQTIVWTANDKHTGTYKVFRDNLEIENGSWFSKIPIYIPVDNLAVGIYNYTILVIDDYGNSEIDIVFVRVFPSTSPKTGTTIPSDSTTTQEDTRTFTSSQSDSSTQTESDNAPGFLFPHFLLGMIVILFFRKKFD